MVRATLVLALVAAQGYGQSPYPLPQSVLSKPTWEEREVAFHKMLQTHKVTEPILQRTVIELMSHEATAPENEGAFESDKFQRYDEELIDLTMRFATQYHNEEAYAAFAKIPFNPGSPVAELVVQHTRSMQIILDDLNSPDRWRQGDAVQLIGEAIADCDAKPSIESCSLILPQRQRLLDMLRHRVRTEDPDWVADAIDALGHCGDEQDAVYFQQQVDKLEAEGVDKSDLKAFERWGGMRFLYKQAVEKIRKREAVAKVRGVGSGSEGIN